jgi:pimeloyl-ACP methyl ester carboxylesterase
MYGSKAPPPLRFQYKDGGSSIYYSFTVGDEAQPETAIFFYGGTGCASWKSVMPDYVNGLTINARIFVLNKRFVPDRSIGFFDCGLDFHGANNPDQWVADYSEFITSKIRLNKPENVVLVGVSEGVFPALTIAGQLPEITHLAIIGAGGYTIRKSLTTLHQKGTFKFDVSKGWKKISKAPHSNEKKWLNNTYNWWSSVMDLDPLPDFLKLDLPILVGFGEQDTMVAVESAYFLKSEFDKARKNNLILKTYPGVNHRLYGNGISYRKEYFAELSRLIQTSKSAN